MLDQSHLSQAIRHAAQQIEDWLEGPCRPSPDVFKVEGYAGTGKTTLIKHLISRLGEEDVYCAALSGKAAHVMHSKGIKNASTIHSLIYRWEAPPAEKVQQLQQRINATPNTPENRDRLHALTAELRDLNQPRFKLNRDSRLYGARVLILDEVSMVGQALAKDVLSFGRPTLVVGDPGQLPPVDGSDTGYFDRINPDIELTEPHRQEAGSPIVEFATDIRLGKPWQKYGSTVSKNTMRNLGVELFYTWLSKADQVICGFNDNRRKINIELLRRGGFEGTYPTRGSEKLVCLKNDKQRGLFNGMPVALAEVHDEGHEKYFRAKVLVADESGRFTEERGEAKIYKGYFESAVDGNEQRIEADRDFRARERLVELDWGYCITAHKAQGSEWNKVLVVNDGWGLGRKGGEDLHRRWLYTAVTRASKRVAVVGVDRL